MSGRLNNHTKNQITSTTSYFKIACVKFIKNQCDLCKNCGHNSQIMLIPGGIGTWLPRRTIFYNADRLFPYGSSKHFRRNAIFFPFNLYSPCQFTAENRAANDSGINFRWTDFWNATAVFTIFLHLHKKNKTSVIHQNLVEEIVKNQDIRKRYVNKINRKTFKNSLRHYILITFYFSARLISNFHNFAPF